MKKTFLILSVVALGACAKGEKYESAGTVDSARPDTTDTTRGLDVQLGIKKDTINLPIIGTEKDTIIVNKPVVKGRKPVEVKRPTVDVTKKP